MKNRKESKCKTTQKNLPANNIQSDGDGNGSNDVPFYKNEKIQIAFITAGASVIAAIIAGCVSIYGKILDKEYQMELVEMEKAYVQEFVNHAVTNAVLGMTYVDYEITATPTINGFQVKPYSYIEYDIGEGKKYLFLNNQFTQAQYDSDRDGLCTMRKEDTAEELVEEFRAAYEEKYPDRELSVSSGCVVAIKYTNERIPYVSFFELTVGSMPVLTDSDLLNAISEYESSNSGINMISWPYNIENILTEII